MSSVQTKLNFLEKKKTSARLQETFVLKNINSKLVKGGSEKCTKTLETDLKKIHSNDVPSPSKRNDRLNKENKGENKMSSTPTKSRQNQIQECNDPVLRRSPIKRGSSSVSLVSCSTTSPTKLRKDQVQECNDPVLRRSPIKRESSSVSLMSCRTTSPIKYKQDKIRECNDPVLRRSPIKRGASPSIPRMSCSKEEGSSPPKRGCSQEETPSQLITSLSLDSPIRQNLKSRKELFPKGELDEACKALHSCAPSQLPGREDKLEIISGYLKKHGDNQTSGTMYISGPPGTGKTACVNLATSDFEISKNFKVVSLNCTTLNSCGSIYSRICRELKIKCSHSDKGAKLAIEKYLDSKKRKMLLIVLDELDQLCTNKQSVLYSVFEWPARQDSRVVLLGIANALDLTDRVLPRLQSLAVHPTVLHFPSYTRQQITEIITDRLRQAGVEEVFSGATLQLLAGKVAAVNGDVRRALDIARRVVEMAEKRIILKSPKGSTEAKQTVALQEVMAVLNDVYNTSQTLDSSEADSFPLQQKLLICSLLLHRQTSKSKDITIGSLYEVYKKVCDRRNLTALDISEFTSLASLVQSRGILKVTGKNHNRLSKVVLQWDEQEVKSALQDKQLLAAVLTDRA